MKPNWLNLISPRAHLAIDLLVFPGLMLASALVARRDARAARVVFATALAEGAALATTDYPPAVVTKRIGFVTHNVLAATCGLGVAVLAARLPKLSPFGRLTLAGLSAVPITLAILSDTSRASRLRAPSPAPAARPPPHRTGR